MPKLNFDSETHTYTLENGRHPISVTKALELIDERRKDPYYLWRGQCVHKATAYYDRRELDFTTIDPQIQGYFNAYLRFRANTDFEPTYIELPQYHPVFDYCGTLDRLGSLNGFQILIDLKSGAPAPKIDPIQNAAYWELSKANGLKVDKLFDLYLHENGTYKLEPVKNPRRLLFIFLACLKVTQWRENLL